MADSPTPDADREPTRTTTPAPPEDHLVTTEHTLRLGRRRLAYTATTGRVVLREEVFEDGTFTGHEPKAEMFLTAYVAEPSGDTPRPVTFAFNGGPGSSSVWLHLGLLGPRRVVSGDAGSLQAPPYGLTDNLETLLAVSDLVFVDPVATGYSRAVSGGKAAPYLGFTGDIESVGEVIRLWTTRNDRWLSPKFVAGESYGTIRAAALAEHLQTRRGMYLNGVMLISSVLDLGSIGLHEPEDRGHVGFLPTYAAIAHHHGKHGDRPLEDVLAEAEEYAERTYPWVLSRGDRLTAADRAEAVATLARLTGLSEEYVDLSDLRVEHLHFFAELLRTERRVVGRLDGRFTGPAASGVAETIAADPSMDAITGPYSAGWNHYVRTELGYESDLPYEQLSMTANQEWSFKEFEGRSVDVSGRLARAMRANPDLKVHVAYGWHDGATPYYAAQETLAHLGLPPELTANIEHAYYPAGHMMYVHEESRVRQSADLADFVTRASTP
ncbi:peptidase S10 [Phycicoccus sp. BSK3Z-2]|uniref:Peptidase S10 n=1 Tax=Phycicoccus avicenniae TaxID=2828860 RepID=A0A941D635_9MICO|nr:peptidase S10 [Phycicoccus avicenniae]MBR7741813.1 peptidase S10 [Phycicoccus avicenniae]